ncbi:hypothetical protein Lfu02_25120 [Longispora fulva]|uniref:Uncharacterized protein n=1 Tax=Longispora fulva TaxID=619741 RepID=A0A8J7GM37_9ACTN|nr:hypothetical protein [Longispora fulva]MBG6139477.1 hypothetical protein [Longispora fulva]GIG58140.1 hypothetical protein Lfu02_25120 [Longispora fulva]
MSAIPLNEVGSEVAADEALRAAHLDSETGCCVACQRPWPCDTYLDAGNRLGNRLLGLTRRT